MNVVQPAGLTGGGKLIAAITTESIAGAVLAEGLAWRAELDVRRFDPRLVRHGGRGPHLHEPAADRGDILRTRRLWFFPLFN